MKKFIRKYGLLLVTLIGLLVLICFALLLIPEFQIPTMLQSSGLVAIISAFLGVLMTVAVTAFLLEKQTASESKKEKDVKIFKQKIEVYSEFLSAMWGMLDKEEYTIEELKQLRTICFQKLFFYLNDEQTKKISEQIKNINPEDYNEGGDSVRDAMGRITHILQENLDASVANRTGSLLALYNSFTYHKEAEQQTEQGPVNDQSAKTYWHFCMYGDEQLKAFANKNWTLALVEYGGERWRSNLLEQIKPNDVIFLFRRGGYGYIGAFRAKAKGIGTDNPECKSAEEIFGSDKDKYDMYDAIEDSASTVANVEVEPIAYNYKGVGCKTPRRRTIERMNDTDAVKFILKRFNGELDKDWGEEKLSGKDKLDENTEIKEIIEREYFNKIIKQFNM
jgi:hypothetical protein